MQLHNYECYDAEVHFLYLILLDFFPFGHRSFLIVVYFVLSPRPPIFVQHVHQGGIVATPYILVTKCPIPIHLLPMYSYYRSNLSIDTKISTNHFVWLWRHHYVSMPTKIGKYVHKKLAKNGFTLKKS